MNRKEFVKLIADMPQGADQDDNFIHNAGKFAVVLLLLIILTEALYFLKLGHESLLMLYFLGVLAISVMTPRYGFGVAAAIIASFAYTLLISEPSFGSVFGFHFFSTLLTMLIITVAASSLTIMLKLRSYLAQMRAERADTLCNLGEELVDAKDKTKVAEITVKYLSKQLDCPAILFLTDPKVIPIDIEPPVCAGDAAPFLTQSELANAHRAFLSVSSINLLAEEDQSICYYPVIWNSRVHGVAGVNFAEKHLSSWKKELIDCICRQAAHALELLNARGKQNDLRIDAEKEKMRGNLLSSISHDFRMPLTSILGASNAILEQKDMLVEMRDSLLKDIQENARWLTRILENILTVTQISRESMKLHKRLESAEEVIAQSVSIIRSRFPNAMIHVRTPESLMMIPMDATLISQVIINLLENAIKHSDDDSFVLMSLRQKGHLALFEVSDHGAGIPANMLDSVFEIHTQPEDEVSADAERGIGIGLNICRTIIQAHNGIIEASNRREGGARFSFWLPLDDNGTEREATVK